MTKFYIVELAFGIALSAEYYVDQYLRSITSFYRIPTGIMFWTTLLVTTIISSTLRIDFGLTKVQQIIGGIFVFLPLVIIVIFCRKWF